MINTFMEFVDHKQRESKRHLVILEKVFKKQNVSVKSYTDEDNPYLYIPVPEESLSFGGVRVYQVGDTIAYRVQKKEDTLPFGRAYQLDIEEMYEDFMSDDIKEDDAAQRVVETIADEIQRFFKKSKDAESDFNDMEFDKQLDGVGKIMLKSSPSDYANSVSSGT